MTVLGVALRRQRHPKESLGTTPVSAPHSAATPTVPVELPTPVAAPQPIAAPRPVAVPVAVTVDPPSVDESAESSRKVNKRKRAFSPECTDVPASPKTDEPMTIFGSISCKGGHGASIAGLFHLRDPVAPSRDSGVQMFP